MGDLLLDLWSQDKKAVMFVTHDLEEAIALADRVVIMSAGPRARIMAEYKIPSPDRVKFQKSASTISSTKFIGKYGAHSRKRFSRGTSRRAGKK